MGFAGTRHPRNRIVASDQGIASRQPTNEFSPTRETQNRKMPQTHQRRKLAAGRTNNFDSVGRTPRITGPKVGLNSSLVPKFAKAKRLRFIRMFGNWEKRHCGLF